ncbi:MAG: epoxyqueuosine reductase QueH [Syntrophobacterales bacterium]|jgi:predicted adenine nucleotide alpha hydrolase (AANH) superfamily ATPase|nr:epoxyqueuosine reductase QueH [Syntrophobacterales bacterium]
MKILLHICCGPCAVYPLKILRQEGFDILGLFYNPNIHPYLEYEKRRETLRDFAAAESLSLMIEPGYSVEQYFRRVSFDEENRCHYCYQERLRHAFAIARKKRMDALTTTLLYSKYQKHDLIVHTAKSLARDYGVSFYYHDFREGWQEGVQLSKERSMYRQKYCGCIYSERERFYRE